MSAVVKFRYVLLAMMAAANAVGWVGGGAQAQGHARTLDSAPDLLDPILRPYGPGRFFENGAVVYVPVNCYVSREQVLRNGVLVWRPLRVCPSPGYK